MLRNLLAERFKLAVHRESREFSGYALVQTKGGSKLQEVPSGSSMISGRSPGSLKITGAMAIVAALPQLGLKLEPRKLQKDIVVVDYAETVPAEN